MDSFCLSVIFLVGFSNYINWSSETHFLWWTLLSTDFRNIYPTSVS
jgi:hypothetical protein